MHDLGSNRLYLLRVQFDKLRNSRNQSIEEFANQDVQGHLPCLSVPMHPYYQQNYPTSIENHQKALNYFCEALTIPFFYSITDSDIKTVVKTIKT